MSVITQCPNCGGNIVKPAFEGDQEKIKMSETKSADRKWGRCDYKVETLRLADDLKMLTGSAYYDRIESELLEAEERGRRVGMRECAEIAEDAVCDHSAMDTDRGHPNHCPVIGKARDIAKAIRARMEEK